MFCKKGNFYPVYKMYKCYEHSPKFLYYVFDLMWSSLATEQLYEEDWWLERRNVREFSSIKMLAVFKLLIVKGTFHKTLFLPKYTKYVPYILWMNKLNLLLHSWNLWWCIISLHDNILSFPPAFFSCLVLVQFFYTHKHTKYGALYCWYFVSFTHIRSRYTTFSRFTKFHPFE